LKTVSIFIYVLVSFLQRLFIGSIFFIVDICRKWPYIFVINICQNGDAMPRPKRCRRICAYPDCWSFSPDTSAEHETVLLMLDELETIRLIDYHNKTQEECAAIMGVSRATVTGIYDSARRKIADALIHAKRIRVTGGAYRMDAVPAAAVLQEKGENIMRIAVTYENGMVGQHFGRTEQFKIYDIEDGEVKSSQVIDTNGTGHGALAGFLRAAEVGTLICGGIGMGARNALEEVGIRLLPGVGGDADETVRRYLTGTLDYDPDTECHHHEHEEGHVCRHGSCGSNGCRQ
jgi:predicted DNA-binding protein (UPF0251 family)/predicted Fe-Mo cluster-binding NifX family protein